MCKLLILPFTIALLSFAPMAIAQSSTDSEIRDGWMKIKIESLEEARESNRLMDEEFSGNNHWSERFEANLNAVMAI